MKRILAAALCFLTLVLCLIPAVSAADAEDPRTETLENGDRLVTGIGEPLLQGAPEDAGVATLARLLRFFRRLVHLLTGTKTTERSKYLRYYDHNGVLLWEATLTAEFAYSARRVRCERATLSFVSQDPDWSLVSRQTETAGDAARGTVSVRQTKLGVPLQTVTRTLTLTCDSNGNVS